jgi:hypothetical protein
LFLNFADNEIRKKEDIMKTKFALALGILLAMMACQNVVTPPTPVVPIAVGYPQNGAVLTDPVTITAIPGSGFVFNQVDFYIDSLLVASDSISPFQYDWNFYDLESGSNHTLYVVGFTADSSYGSDTVHVRLQFAHGLSFISVYRPGSQHAIGVTNYYNVLFVSTGTDGLEVIDIRDKYAPQFLSRLITGGQAMHSAVIFPYVYVAELNQVEMADFENVDSLIPVYNYQLESLKRDVAVSDNFIFSIENDGLSILDPSDLQPYSRYSFPQDLLNYAVARHDTAFVVGNNGFYVVDCTNPDNPAMVGTYNNLNLANSVAVTDTFAFIANGSDGVIALSISHPTNPRPLAARFNTGSIMKSVAVGDGYLFAGSISGRVDALVYTTADTLTSISNFDVGTIIEEIRYDSNYLFVAANANVDILRFVP